MQLGGWAVLKEELVGEPVQTGPDKVSKTEFTRWYVCRFYVSVRFSPGRVGLLGVEIRILHPRNPPCGINPRPQWCDVAQETMV